MIDINNEFATILFCGDLDEPVTLTKADGTTYNLTGIFSYQAENPEIQNVSISDAAKLTLTIAATQLTAKGLTGIEDNSDIFTIRGTAYTALTSRKNPTTGLIVVTLGE